MNSRLLPSAQDKYLGQLTVPYWGYIPSLFLCYFGPLDLGDSITNVQNQLSSMAVLTFQYCLYPTITFQPKYTTKLTMTMTTVQGMMADTTNKNPLDNH